MVCKMRLSLINSWLGLSGRQPIPRRRSLWICLVLALCCGLAGIGFAQRTPPAVPAGMPQLDVDPAEGFRSVFNDDPAYGKDPFFPNSTRPRDGTQPDPIPIPIPIPASGKVPWELFELKGISISSAKRLALINNYTLAEGESRDYKFPSNLSYKLTCITIKERSVIVSVFGQKNELSLRAGL